MDCTVRNNNRFARLQTVSVEPDSERFQHNRMPLQILRALFQLHLCVSYTQKSFECTHFTFRSSVSPLSRKWRQCPSSKTKKDCMCSRPRNAQEDIEDIRNNIRWYGLRHSKYCTENTYYFLMVSFDPSTTFLLPCE